MTDYCPYCGADDNYQCCEYGKAVREALEEAEQNAPAPADDK